MGAESSALWDTFLKIVTLISSYHQSKCITQECLWIFSFLCPQISKRKVKFGHNSNRVLIWGENLPHIYRNIPEGCDHRNDCPSNSFCMQWRVKLLCGTYTTGTTHQLNCFKKENLRQIHMQTWLKSKLYIFLLEFSCHLWTPKTLSEIEINNVDSNTGNNRK